MQVHEATGSPKSGTRPDVMPSNVDLRELALTSIRKRREFVAHVVAYVTMNAFLIGIWAVSGVGFFWPVFPLLGWGIGLFFHGWDTYRTPITEDAVQREVDRLRRQGLPTAPNER